MAVNFEGLLNVTRTFEPVMESNGGGKVVNMLSLLSLVSAPGFSAYNASKAAAWSIAMSLRAYLEPKGISVLNVFPAGIDTDMLAGVDGPKDDPEAVVADVLRAIESDAEDVYPGVRLGRSRILAQRSQGGRESLCRHDVGACRAGRTGHGNRGTPGKPGRPGHANG